MFQLIGNAPNQVPTNADLGGMAYQDPRYVNITGGNVNVTNFSAANISLGTVTSIAITSGYIGNISNAYISGNLLTSGNITITDNTQSTSSSSGALIVTGGVGVGANLYVGGNATISGNLTVQNISYENREVITTTETIQGNIVATSTDTSTSTTTGALVVPNGGAGIGGNVIAGGQVKATTGLYSTGAFNGGYSDGIVVDYTNTLGRISVGSADSIRFYQGGPASTESLLIAATTGNIVIAATTSAVSATTGALVVKGGIGAAGLVVTSPDDITLTTSGTANFTSTAGKFLFTTGNIVSTSSQAATSVTNAALVLSGGVGVGNGLYVNGITYLQNVSTANAHILSSDAAIGIDSLNVVNAIGNVYSIAAQVTNLSAANVRLTGTAASWMRGVAIESANIVMSGGSIGTTAAGALSAIANIYATTGTFTNLSSSNVRLTGGYATSLANVTAGNLYVTDVSSIDYAPNAVMPKAYTDAFSIIFGA